jgi:ankyrin repeat protein
LKSLDHKLKIVYYFYIFSACKFNSINIVNILIQARANLDIGDANGQTALMGGNL